jgi:hypothetical protein
VEYNWQGSDNKKLSMLKNLYKNEIDDNKQLSSFSFEDKPVVHICNSNPPQDTLFWYVQCNQFQDVQNLIKYYFNLKKNLNIKNVLIKDASYSTLFGYMHILIDQYDKVTYLRNEHEIDAILVDILVEEKIDASS